MYDTILVPTDGSPVAEAAVDAAVALADRVDASVHAIHVLELGEVLPGVSEETRAELEELGERATSTAVDRARAAGIDATATLYDGNGAVHEVIADAATEVDADCIVMGTYGRTGIDRLVLGSVAERTLRTASVPVLTVHDETVYDPRTDTILVAVDGSEPADRAADHAIAFAAATGAHLHLLTVVDPAVTPTGSDIAGLVGALEEAGQRTLEEVTDRATAAGVAVEDTSVLTGPPHSAIVETATDVEAGLVVVGTHGRTGLERTLLGSVAERVVRLSAVPVMTVGSGVDGDDA